MPYLTKRSFTLAGHRTSVALEPAFWTVIEHAAERDGMTVARLVAKLDAARPADQPLASTLRLHALRSALGDRAASAGFGHNQHPA